MIVYLDALQLKAWLGTTQEIEYFLSNYDNLSADLLPSELAYRIEGDEDDLLPFQADLSGLTSLYENESLTRIASLNDDDFPFEDFTLID